MGFLKRYIGAICIFAVVEFLILCCVFYLLVSGFYAVGFMLEMIGVFSFVPFASLIYRSEKYVASADQALAKAKQLHDEELSTISKALNFSNDLSRIEALASLSDNQIHENLIHLISDFSKREKENIAINEILASTSASMEIEKFFDAIMQKLLDLTQSNWIAFYLVDKNINKLQIKSSIGFSQKIYKQFDITVGEGFVGAVAATGQVKIIADIPDDTIYLSHTILGKIKPKSLLLVPVVDDDEVVEGVVVLGSLYGYNDDHVNTMYKIRSCISIAIYNNNFYNVSQRLSKEIKFQNQLIQDLNTDQELKIAERTKFLLDVYDSMSELVVLAVDTSYTILFANSSAAKIFNMPKDDLVGKNIQILTNSSFMLSKFKKGINFALNNGKSIDTFEFSDSESSVISVSTMICAIYTTNKQVSGATILFENSKIVKQKNPKSPENRALLVTDEHGIVESTNKITETMLNKQPANIVGKKISKFFRDEEAVDSFINELKLSEKNIDLMVILKESGKPVTLSATAVSYNKSTKKLFIYMK